MRESYILILFILFYTASIGQNIYRFEHFDSEDGLSQNTVSSILCDNKGFLWVGTMNGLNRYDGYQFKIYKSQKKGYNLFSNNRISDLWQDDRGFIWMQTYDGCYHYLNPEKESIHTFPKYDIQMREGGNEISCFLQFDSTTVWLGSTNNGIYELKLLPNSERYAVKNFFDKGKYNLSNNDIRFIMSDQDSNLWIGSKNGLNVLSHDEAKQNAYTFQHFFVTHSFTSSIELANELWFGTENHGLVVFNKANQRIDYIDNSFRDKYPTKWITDLKSAANGVVLVCFMDQGIAAYDPSDKSWHHIDFHGNNVIDIYLDNRNNAWLTSRESGVTRLDLATFKTTFYEIGQSDKKEITDLERHVFYEDRYNTLWVGLHGGALSFYDREKDKFKVYYNDPNDPGSISSNFVHSIAEDRTGQMWLGTGQFMGGLEKIIPQVKAIEHLLPEEDFSNYTDNLTRAMGFDNNDCLWLGTKGGMVHVFDENLKKLHAFRYFDENGKDELKNNIYSIFVDKTNRLWLGSKGQGLLVSTTPIPENKQEYKNLKFKRYLRNDLDSTSIAANNIYTITQDEEGTIWIGTYGNGLSRVLNSDTTHLKFQTYNTKNSNLSNDQIRHIIVDTNQNLWIATTFGLNFISTDSIKDNLSNFKRFYYSPENESSLSYNDVVYILEDSKKQLWFGTFGGGLNKLESMDDNTPEFKHFDMTSGLSHDVIFGILEDRKGKLWLSSENGLFKLDEENSSVEVFNEYNGLSFNNFSEGTCCIKGDGRILFGGFKGVEVIDPGYIHQSSTSNLLELTNFQLFNQDAEIDAKKSPLTKSISFTNQLELNHDQSSFSIAYSSLDLLDPKKVQYAFILEDFDQNIHYVGNQTKATYTNLKHGEYVFKVRSTNRNGQWNTKWRELLIVIKPPWWLSTYAYIGYLFMLILLFYSGWMIVKRINKFRNDLIVEKKVNELKLRFFTNISHEIRTPLTLILGPIEDLINQNGSFSHDAAKSQLGLIKRNTQRLLQLVNQLLDFRKIQNNKMKLSVRQLEIVSFAKDIYENFIPLANHKEIHYSFSGFDEPINVWADPAKLDSIIYNLISNAIKFTSGGKKVHVSVSLNKEKRMAEIQVLDEGPGIPEKNISEMFTRYSLLSNQDNTGTGIGLSLAYELAKLHQGTINLSTEEGKGSTFTFEIPSERSVLEKSSYIEFIEDSQENLIQDNGLSRDLIKIKSNEKLKVNKNNPVLLIVEDNEDIANYLASSLSKEFNCIKAGNGKEALELTEEHNPDIIITDVMMPVMNGTELTKKIKQDFATCHIPVIMLTAKTGMQDQVDGFDAGAEAYVTKPLNIDYLKAVLNSFIKQRQLLITKYRDNKTIDPKKISVNSKDETFLSNIVQYIEQNYQKDLSVEHIAEVNCVSRTVFYNKIKGLTGLSPLEFIRALKLKIALQLLQKGYSVSEVAFEIGYNDVKYFSKQFKAQFGYPPSKLRT